MVTSTTTSHSHSHGHELPQKCPKIIKTNDDKLFSKLLSKENSSSINDDSNNNNNMNSSFRVYYGGAAGAAIPFMWESTPGTPKHPLSETSLPPLTPPPSYQGLGSNNSSSTKSSSSSKKKHSRHKLLYTIFPRLISRKKTQVSSPLSSSSSLYSMSSSPSYSSSSSSNSNMNPNFRGSYFVSRPKSPIYFGFDDQEELERAVGSSPTSTLCFGAKRGTISDVGFRGCFRWSM